MLFRPSQITPGVLFRALLQAGADAVAAYTAEQGTLAMVWEAAATQLQPLVAETRQLFAEQDRQNAERDRKIEAVTNALAEQGRQINALAKVQAEQGRQIDVLTKAQTELERRLDVVVQRLDGLRMLGQVMLGALALLVTTLIAVFGFLFTR